MIATVVFFAEEHVFEGMLVGDMQVAVMRKGAREVFVGAGAWFKDVELVSGKGGHSQEGTEKARSLWGVQDGC